MDGNLILVAFQLMVPNNILLPTQAGETVCPNIAVDMTAELVGDIESL